MSGIDIVRASIDPDARGPVVVCQDAGRPARTDRARLGAMTDAGIDADANRDPDNPPPSDDDLAAVHYPGDSRSANGPVVTPG